MPTELETSSRTHARLLLYVSIVLHSLRFMETKLLTHDVIVKMAPSFGSGDRQTLSVPGIVAVLVLIEPKFEP